MAEASMTTPSREPSNCQSSEDSQDSEMGLQWEQRGGRLAGADVTHGMDAQCLSIDDLPDEILIKIFSHMSFGELVDVVQKVCTRWKRLSQDFELWTDKEYEIRYWNVDDSYSVRGGITDEEAVRTFCEVPNLHKVRARRGVKSRILHALYKNCRRLTELHLHISQKLSYSVLKNLVEQCCRIHTLTIPSGLLESEKYSEAVSRLNELRVLEIRAFLPEFVPDLRPLADGCPHLAEVDFRTTEVDMDDLRHFLNAKRNTLVSLRIKWAMFENKCVTPLLAECATGLERLELYEFDTVGYAAEGAFPPLGKLRNLREFATSICDPTPPGTGALAFESGGLQKLRRLDLRQGYSLEDDTVVAICRGCPALQELLLRDCEPLSDAAFSQICRLKNLEVLDVSYCSGLGGGFLPLLVGLPRLCTLLLEELEFPKLQPGVGSLLELSGLRCLSLNYSVVTGVPFDEFPGKLDNLRELKIQGCRGDPKATYKLRQQMEDLKIEGSIEEVNPFSYTRDLDQESDAEEEETDEDEVWDEEDRGDGSDSDDAIWDEECISVLFLEDE